MMSADASSMPRELLAMQVYVPASEMCEGEMSKLPDSRRVNLGSCTEPLANTRSPETCTQTEGESSSCSPQPAAAILDCAYSVVHVHPMIMQVKIKYVQSFMRYLDISCPHGPDQKHFTLLFLLAVDKNT